MPKADVDLLVAMIMLGFIAGAAMGIAVLQFIS